jgi:hypothetical protein
MEQLCRSVHPRLEHPPGKPLGHPRVKIALLDTGIETRHPFVKGATKAKRIKEIRNFVDGNNSVGDVYGRGTYSAALILQVAPEAHLYVARIAVSPEIPRDHRVADVRYIMLCLYFH